VVDFPTATNTMLSQIQRYSLSSFGFSAVGGVSYRPTDWVGFGLRVQSPFIQVSGTGDSFQANYQVQTGTLTTADEDKKDVDANYRLPLDMTLGTAFHLGRKVDLLVDTSFQVGTSYESIPGAIASSKYDTDPTFRFNVGADLKFIPSLPLSLGFFYNPSAQRDFVEGESNTPRFDIMGFTVGVTYLTEHIETGAGFFCFFGKGQTNPTDSATDLEDVSSRAMGALITTAYVF
jgi:long-subunit fatty acid transport protein